MNKLTPPYWSVAFGDQKALYIVGDLPKRVIAEVRIPVGVDPSADARLIASAPELLEALIQIAAKCDSLDVNFGIPQIAKAAIIKATGE